MEIKPNFEVKNVNTLNARLVLPDQTAFPSTELMTFGLTKREYFAALAMQAMIANSDLCYEGESVITHHNTGFAVQIADNLIESLNK
jgi:hypothetical protein